MNTIKGLKLTSAITFALLGAYQPVSAGTTGPRAPSAAAALPDLESAIPDAPAPGHGLKNTYIHQGDLETSITAGVYTALDKAGTIQCKAAPCTIMAHMTVQQGDNTTSANKSIVLLYVDGEPAAPAYYVGETPIDGTYSDITQDTEVNNLGAGNHTVQMFYLTGDGAFVGHFLAAYTVYNP